MDKIAAVIVVYNKSLTSSRSFASIGQTEGVKIVVVDNSDPSFDNEQHAQEMGCRYIGMGYNAGLSRAYNAAINLVVKDADIVCLFDDDTDVDPNYFDAVRYYATNLPNCNVFVPVVIDSAGMLSPCTIKGAFCKRAESVAAIPSGGITAINSGMAVRTDVFEQYRYDEGQFLDYVDHAFLRDITGHDKARICVMEEIVLHQQFSGSEKQAKASAKKRYDIFQKDVRYFCNKYGVPKTCCAFLLFKRRLHIYLQGILRRG